jgi:hypothetical protein
MVGYMVRSLEVGIGISGRRQYRSSPLHAMAIRLAADQTIYQERGARYP